ncbi:MAG: hypothetical protein ACOX4V_10600 [Anaerovoracaceae bacterium]|jgi:hypothetical protein|nr:hypothetical protein [Clostridiales bacterium]
MKQIIVMISMIILGIAIAGAIGSFEDTANTISQTTNQRIVSLSSDWQ